MFDILIIGAGPAGSNLARLLGSTTKYSVCLLEKRRLDLPEDPLRQKACGGLLSPDAQKIMAKLELSLPASVLEDPQIFKVRTIDFDNGLERYYPRHYLNMNRERFDRYLFELVPEAIDKRCGMVVKDIYAMDGYCGLKHAEKRYDLSCNSVRRNLMMKRLKSPAMYWPKLRGAVMASGLTSIKTEVETFSTKETVKRPRTHILNQ